MEHVLPLIVCLIGCVLVFVGISGLLSNWRDSKKNNRKTKLSMNTVSDELIYKAKASVERVYYAPVMMDTSDKCIAIVKTPVPFPELPPIDVVDCYKNSKIRKTWKDVVYYYIGDL